MFDFEFFGKADDVADEFIGNMVDGESFVVLVADVTVCVLNVSVVVNPVFALNAHVFYLRLLLAILYRVTS